MRVAALLLVAMTLGFASTAQAEEQPSACAATGALGEPLERIHERERARHGEVEPLMLRARLLFEEAQQRQRRFDDALAAARSPDEQVAASRRYPADWRFAPLQEGSRAESDAHSALRAAALLCECRRERGGDVASDCYERERRLSAEAELARGRRLSDALCDGSCPQPGSVDPDLARKGAAMLSPESRALVEEAIRRAQEGQPLP